MNDHVCCLDCFCGAGSGSDAPSPLRTPRLMSGASSAELHWLSRLPRLAASGDREGAERRSFSVERPENRQELGQKRGEYTFLLAYGFFPVDRRLVNAQYWLEVFDATRDVVTRIHGKLMLADELTLLLDLSFQRHKALFCCFR